MRLRKMHLDALCPACHAMGLEYAAIELEVPYFGHIIQTIVTHDACGFRHVDVLNARTSEPTRFTYAVRAADDMSVRVVRSTSGTIRIPELGIKIEPGPVSESYVSNIEGVLLRVDAILHQLENDAEDAAARQRVLDRRHRIEAARAGQVPFTLILDDPYGNSLIAHPGAVEERIPPGEAEELARGEIIFDLPPIPRPNGGDGAPTKAP